MEPEAHLLVCVLLSYSISWDSAILWKKNPLSVNKDLGFDINLDISLLLLLAASCIELEAEFDL